MHRLQIASFVFIYTALLLIGCSPKQTSNSLNSDTPDVFATEFGVSATELLGAMLTEDVEPSDTEKERILLSFVKSRIDSSTFDHANSQLDDYIDEIRVDVQDGHILFFVNTDFSGEAISSSQESIIDDVFYELFIAGVVSSTNADEEFVWAVKTIGVTFEFQNGEWIDIFVTKDNIYRFMENPSSLFELIEVETSRGQNSSDSSSPSTSSLQSPSTYMNIEYMIPPGWCHPRNDLVSSICPQFTRLPLGSIEFHSFLAFTTSQSATNSFLRDFEEAGFRIIDIQLIDDNSIDADGQPVRLSYIDLYHPDYDTSSQPILIASFETEARTIVIYADLLYPPTEDDLNYLFDTLYGLLETIDIK